MALSEAHASALAGATQVLPPALEQRVAWLLGRCPERPPSASDLEEGDPAVMARASFYDVRASWLALEAPRTIAVDVARRLLEHSDPDASSWGAAALALAGLRPSTDWAGVENGARARGDGPLVAELALLRAMAHEVEADSETALRSARRAARMARTERFATTEFAASLVLARSRRLAGFPHLGSHILSRLRQLAPSAYHPRLNAEHFFAGGAARAPFDELREAAAAGNRSGLAAAFLRGMQVLEHAPALQTDLALLRSLLDADAQVPAEGLAWARRETDLVPRGLHGIDALSPVAGIVLARPGREPRRILSLGLPLHQVKGRLCLTEREHRSLAAGALLAMRSEPMARDEFFLALYGFPYVPRYGNTLSVLLHRLRKRFEGLATVHRSDDEVHLQVIHPAAIDDPRTRGTVAEQALRIVAVTGAIPAREVAGRLGRPLRTVQTALHGLLESGAIESEAQGTSVLYSVEDTTFSDTTLALRREALLP